MWSSACMCGGGPIGQFGHVDNCLCRINAKSFGFDDLFKNRTLHAGVASASSISFLCAAPDLRLSVARPPALLGEADPSEMKRAAAAFNNTIASSACVGLSPDKMLLIIAALSPGSLTER